MAVSRQRVDDRSAFSDSRPDTWIIELRHDYPMPEDTERVFVLCFPEPDAPKPTIDQPARLKVDQDCNKYHRVQIFTAK